MEEGKTGIELELNEEKLLYYLIDNKIKVIKSVIYYNKIDYDSVKDFEEYREKKEFDTLLDALTEKGYLSKTEHDRVIHCPNCDSKHHETKYNCPQCNSTKVRRFELIEHLDCGYVGELEEFEKSNGKLICPKCSTMFLRNSGAYEVIGISYICDNCGYKFDKPNTSHHCQNCGTIYDYTNSIYSLIYTYQTTPKITELLPVREIRETLRALEALFLEREYAVTLEGKLIGKSGEEKQLSVIAEKPGNLVIVDISPWGKPDNIINMLGKKMELEPKAAIIVDLSDENTLLPLEDIYKIKVVSGKTPEYITKIGEYLSSLMAPMEEKKTFLGSMFERQQKRSTQKNNEINESDT
jgi:transposase-like protein